MAALRDDLLNALGGWSLPAQVEDIAEGVWYGRITGTCYVCTDRELNVLGILLGYEALQGKVGTHRFASGATVSIVDDRDEEGSYQVQGQVIVSDLPEHVARRVQRMPAALQPAREAELPRLHRAVEEMRRQAAENRRRMNENEEV